MSEVSIETVLSKLKSFLELPEDQQPKECPFTEEEKKIFVEHHQTMVKQCPAFHDHACPFTQIHSLKTFKEKVNHIPNVENRCPAMANESTTHDVILKLLKD